MDMKRCERGHYYDLTKHTSCPACGVQGLDVGSTRPIRTNANPENKTAEEGRTVRRGQPRIGENEPGHTVAVIRKKTGIDPVVGWLICVEGNDRGRDYRIRSEKNFIGRSEKMDIAIIGDDTISRDNHAAISYNPKNKTFKIHAGESRGLVYLNGEEVDSSRELKPYDFIEIGQTKLTFVPFCGEKFQWE